MWAEPNRNKSCFICQSEFGIDTGFLKIDCLDWFKTRSQLTRWASDYCCGGVWCLPGPFAVRIACGSDAESYAPDTGYLWSKDVGYSGGSSANLTVTSRIASQLNTIRYFEISDGPENCYNITVPSGHYLIRCAYLTLHSIWMSSLKRFAVSFSTKDVMFFGELCKYRVELHWCQKIWRLCIARVSKDSWCNCSEFRLFLCWFGVEEQESCSITLECNINLAGIISIMLM